MSKFQIQISVLKYVGMFSILLTAITISTLLTPPRNTSLNASPEQQERTPSSVFSIHNFSNPNIEHNVKLEPEFYSHTLNCKDLEEAKSSMVTSKGKNIRLKLNCIQNKDWISVTNISNKHSGQWVKLNSFITSDFIRLSKGNNTLQFLYKNSEGQLITKSLNIVY